MKTPDYRESLNRATLFYNFSTEFLDQSEVDLVSSREGKCQMTNILSLIYGHSLSAAAEDGMFCGLALDDNNESEKTSSRIGAWVEKLKAHLS